MALMKSYGNTLVPIQKILFPSLGLGICLMLLISYLTASTVFCFGGQGCDALRLHPASKFAGLPVPLYGALGYLALTVLGILNGGHHPRRELISTLAKSISLIGVLISGVLIFILKYQIGITCPWCLASALIMALTLFSWATGDRVSSARFAWWVSVPVSSILVGAVVGTQYFLPKPSAISITHDQAALERTSFEELAPNDSLTFGNRDSDSAIVVFTDLQCGVCHAVIPKLVNASEKSRDRLVIRNYPLNGHEFAFQAALVSEMLADQGRSAQYVMACSQENPLKYADFKHIWQDFGIAPASLEGAVRNKLPAFQKVDRDLRLAKILKIAGTPMIFWITKNGTRKIVNPEEGVRILTSGT